jgi:arginine exporter protein ArgO
MTFVRRMMTAGATMLLGYAMKKFMEKMQAQAEAVQQRAEEQRDPSEFKKLKQDPATGEYYAED